MTISRLAKRWRTITQVTSPTIDGWVVALLKRSKARQLECGWDEFDLTRENLRGLWIRQQGLCAVSGLVFDLTLPTRYFGNPSQPSLDRIDSDRGYCLDNMRFVCLGANVAMNQWGLERFLPIAAAMVEKAGGLSHFALPKSYPMKEGV